MSFIQNYGLHEPTLDDWGLETTPITKKEIDEERIENHNADLEAEEEEIIENDRKIRKEEENRNIRKSIDTDSMKDYLKNEANYDFIFQEKNKFLDSVFEIIEKINRLQKQLNNCSQNSSEYFETMSDLNEEYRWFLTRLEQYLEGCALYGNPHFMKFVRLVDDLLFECKCTGKYYIMINKRLCYFIEKNK